MPEMSRAEIASYAVCVLVVALLAWRTLSPERVEPHPSAERSAVTVRTTGAAGTGAAMSVHVVGAVRKPGVYRLPAGSRVEDAVDSAGGPTQRGDVAAVNLAQKVADGQQVIVPRRGQAATGAAGVAGAPVAGGSAAPAAASGAPIDLNNATAEQLDTLDGVGPATAKKILEYRAQHGPFRSIGDLSKIPGIGPKKLAAIRPRVRV